MMQWFRIASLTLAVGVIAALPVSAQPSRRGGSDSGDSVKQIEAELTKLRDQMKRLERKLESAKQKDKGSRFGKGGFGKASDRMSKGGEKGKRDFGPWGGRGGFGPMGGRGGFGPMGGPWGKMGSRESEKSKKGDQGQKGPSRPQGGSSSSGSTKGGPSSSLEKKLDQIQKDLEEIRREMRRR